MSYLQVDYFYGTINCQILTYQEVWVFKTPILDLNVELDIDKWLWAKRQCLKTLETLIERLIRSMVGRGHLGIVEDIISSLITCYMHISRVNLVTPCRAVTNYVHVGLNL